MTRVPDQELLELLDEHPDLRPVVAATQRSLVVERPARRSLRGRNVALVGGALAVAAVVLLVVNLARGGPGFGARADAAIGSGSTIHLRLEQQVASSQVVRLSDGRVTPVHLVTDYWFDVLQHRVHAITRNDGHIVADTTETIDGGSSTTGPVIEKPGRTSLVEPAILALVTRYRQALEQPDSGRRPAGVASSGSVNLRWFSLPGASETAVGVDARTLKPTLLASGSSTNRTTRRIIEFQAISATAARRQASELVGSAASIGVANDVRAIAASELRALVSGSAVWLGTSFGPPRLPLRRLELQRLTDNSQRPASKGATLIYGRLRGTAPDWDAPFVQIQESASPAAAYGVLPPQRAIDSAPPPGSLSIEEEARDDKPGSAIWVGHAELRGPLYVTLQASSRSLLIKAARALRRPPA